MDMAKPIIRFKGYQDDWEQRKLGDIADVTKLAGFEFTEHVVYSDEGNVIALRGLNIKNGQLILDDVKYIDGSNFSKLSRSKLFIDDIMFTYVGTVGEVAIIKENDRFYLAPNVSRIRVKSDDSPKFISHYMRTDNFKNKVIFPLIATSSQPALSMENIRKFTINIPTSREEQDCLAKYFDSLDHLITLHQRKCDETKKLKKYMLQKMFPQNGEKVPEIRFSGFTDDWEQRKLSEFVDKAVDNRGKTPPLDDNGIHPLIEVAALGGVHPDYSKVEKYLNDDSFENNLRAYIKEGDILFTTVGSIGLVSLMDSREEAAIAQNIVAFRAKENFVPEYLYSLFSNEKNQYKAKRIVMGAVQPSIKVSQLVDVEYMLTQNVKEQQKIGEYFSNLDHLITLHQRELENLQNIKKFMLEKMFV